MWVDTECLICFQKYDTDCAWKCTNCNQTCHQFCIEEWYKRSKTCPFCRHTIDSSDLIYLIQDQELPQTEQQELPQTEQQEVVININELSVHELSVNHIIQKLEKLRLESYYANNIFIFIIILMLLSTESV